MSLWRTAAIVGAGLSGLALGMTLINLRTWPRGRPGARLRDPREEADEAEGGERLSVLVPARDEEGSIEACVRAIARSGHPVDEIVVFDDGSTDQTPEILTRLSDQIEQLRVLEGGQGLPPGWVGKPHACHRLAEAATGDVLLFVDADTMLTREGVGRIVSLLQDLEADAVTAVPHQMTGSWAERLILPLLHLTYTSWFPLALTWLSQDVRFLAANGQVLAMRRRAHDDVGGFASVRGEVVDDMAMCRRLKAAGWRVVFADGDQIATCRMYGSARQVWAGFSKNLYEGIGAHPLALAGVIGLYGAAFILPYVALAASRPGPRSGPRRCWGCSTTWRCAPRCGAASGTPPRACCCTRWAWPACWPSPSTRRAGTRATRSPGPGAPTAPAPRARPRPRGPRAFDPTERTRMSRYDAIIIGAGMGGLAAALRLARQGLKVGVLEAMEGPGGKLGVRTHEGVEFDTGPSLLTMRPTLAEVFELAGARLDEELELIEHDVAFEYLWPDGTRLPVHHDLEATRQSVESELGARAREEFDGFMDYARQIWEAARPHFIEGPAPDVGSVVKLGLTRMREVLKIDPLHTMRQGIERRVREPHLRELLTRYATYNGSDPWSAPATLNCIAWVEMGLGGWGVRGGMKAIPRALERVGQRLGVDFVYGARVTRVLADETRGVRGVELEGQPPLEAPMVVCNADVAHLVGELLPAPLRGAVGAPAQPSMSGWTGVIARARSGATLAPHTVLFPTDYRQEFVDIFERDRPPRPAHGVPV